jgi:radical SAM protein with 4Fe4S-binding SPASM domain
MIRFTQLIYGDAPVSGSARRHAHADRRNLAFAEVYRPVIFWNITNRCNLACTHCYIRAGSDRRRSDELSTGEAIALIDDLAAMGVPLLLFTGGEPLLREDFWDLATHARECGLHTVVSTNGTLIGPDVARRLRDVGIEYAGISLDGATAATHDAFRGVPGSFARSVRALEECARAGLKCGVRFTVTRQNRHELGDLITLAKTLGVDRFCVYWLVPSGRGSEIHADQQLLPDEVRAVVDRIYRETLRTDPSVMEFLTVDAPQDGAYLLERLRADGHPAEERATALLARMGGCSAGKRVANIDPSGNVYPCQFAQIEELMIGNVRDRPFEEIWNDPENRVLAAFRNTDVSEMACGRCEDRVVCGMGCRIRAYARYGDLSAPDPFCLKHG